MLNFLAIQNIVLIDKAEIDFTSGLCVLSGETGSGKSILLDALGLALGFRSNPRLIGGASDKALVNASFDISHNKICQNLLEENELLDEEEPHQLNIRRIVKENSNNKTYINDIAIGVNLLNKIGASLVEIHGQHDQKGLLSASSHGQILDEFAQNQDLLKDLHKTYNSLKEIDHKIEEIKQRKEQAERERDYLEYIIKELQSADVKQGEEDELSNKKDQFQAQEKILSFLDDLKLGLVESNSQLMLAQKTIIRNQNIIDNYLGDQKDILAELSNKIDQQNEDLENAVSNIIESQHDLRNNPETLEEIEERLFHIRTLSRKFNVTCNELEKFTLDAQEKLDILQNEQAFTSKLEQEKSQSLEKYHKIAQKISQKRKKSALELAKKVEEELKFLKMTGTKFLVEVSASDQEKEYNTNGYDKIRFLSAINNDNFDNISRIASGGELSRFMLALKVALMNIKSIPTIIFDEIDTGIGGSTADAVGKRLKSLSKNLQILTVTHQPQIASKADVNYKISKVSNNDKVKTVIEKLDDKNKESEIARMLSGEEITPEALAAATRLIGKK